MTKKIYFAPTDWADSDIILNDYKYQTPNNSGIWEDLEATNKLEDADYIVIQDSTRIINQLSGYKKEQLLYFSREALDSQSINNYPNDKFTHFSYWNDTGYLFTKWSYRNTPYGGTYKSYDELTSEVIPEKTEKICCILSNKEMNEGHRLRKQFTKKMLEKYPSLDLYGGVSFANKTLPNNNKYDTLIKYKYSLGYDNQDHINNFFGTQFTDALLAECCPIFWCGTDLSKHFPEGSFIQLNIRNENEVEKIIEIIENDDYSKRIPAIKEAKQLLLNKYNIWPTIKNIIK